jgi:hypothetical protein
LFLFGSFFFILVPITEVSLKSTTCIFQMDFQQLQSNRFGFAPLTPQKQNRELDRAQIQNSALPTQQKLDCCKKTRGGNFDVL